MVNDREQQVADEYKDRGWTPIRGGAPDFLMVRRFDGELLDALFVEVKSAPDSLRFEQKLYRQVLTDILDANYTVEVVA